MTIRPLFAWYDCWVGVYWDRRARALYVLPVPMVGVVIRFGRTKYRPDPRDEKEVCAAMRDAELDDKLVTMTAEQFERWMATGDVPTNAKTPPLR